MHDDFINELKQDPERLKEFLRKVVGPPTRTIEGDEYHHVWLILKMTEPTRTTNNQHSWCEEYYVGGKYYDVHYFPNEEPLIKEVLPE
jgi:hypothetical protein